MGPNFYAFAWLHGLALAMLAGIGLAAMVSSGLAEFRRRQRDNESDRRHRLAKLYADAEHQRMNPNTGELEA